MAREKHDDEHDDRSEAVTEKGGADEGIVAQNLLGEHRRAAEGEGCEEREQGRVNRDETLGAEVGQGPAEGEEITGDEGDAGPQREVFLDALLQDDTREDDGKDGLQLLQQDDHGEAVEMQQKQRLDNGQGAQGTTKQGDEAEIEQVGARHGLQVAVFLEEEQVHQQEREKVDDEDHEGRVEVVELRREQDAVNAPKHGG